MPEDEFLEGVPLENQALTLDELARACAVEPEWVVQHVRRGILLDGPFTSVDLGRARRLAQLERDFDADEDLAALVVDLCDEVRRLKSRLRAAGMA
ncbi:MerR family transcriptional regulator [Pseudoduganella sp. OTU4001]|uniref:MerR family transcriptional regulator n=1 Tax=Pseudoduganella sp. OTU4001 TaxID=3043854 RepID=UPI00313D894D